MQGGIRNIETLRQWFNDVGKPFFTLSYLNGSAGQVILRNTAIDDMEGAWDLLKRQVLAQAESGRATMQLIVYEKKEGANNPSGRTNLDISSAQALPQVAGIGSHPGVGYYADDTKINELLAREKETWTLQRKLEDLEAQINQPADDWAEKLMTGIERISATPVGAMLIGKLMGVPLHEVPLAQVTGTPDKVPGKDADTFDDDIDACTQMLGVSDAELAAGMRKLIEQNPEMAKSLIRQ